MPCDILLRNVIFSTLPKVIFAYGEFRIGSAYDRLYLIVIIKTIYLIFKIFQRTLRRGLIFFGI